MNQFEISNYKNKHLKIRLFNGTEMQGVILDHIMINEASHSQIYSFVKTVNIKAYQKAEHEKDEEKMKEYLLNLDILDIASILFVNNMV